jgi:hypothetical protein
MNRAVLLIAVLFALTVPGASAQKDPCAEKLTENEFGLNYKGYCVAAELDGGNVQPLTVSVTDDLSGTHGLCILIVRTGPDPDDWAIAEPTVYIPKASGLDVGDETCEAIP